MNLPFYLITGADYHRFSSLYLPFYLITSSDYRRFSSLYLPFYLITGSDYHRFSSSWRFSDYVQWSLTLSYKRWCLSLTFDFCKSQTYVRVSPLHLLQLHLHRFHYILPKTPFPLLEHLRLNATDLFHHENI